MEVPGAWRGGGSDALTHGPGSCVLRMLAAACALSSGHDQRHESAFAPLISPVTSRCPLLRCFPSSLISCRDTASTFAARRPHVHTCIRHAEFDTISTDGRRTCHRHRNRPRPTPTTSDPAERADTEHAAAEQWTGTTEAQSSSRRMVSCLVRLKLTADYLFKFIVVGACAMRCEFETQLTPRRGGHGKVVPVIPVYP